MQSVQRAWRAWFVVRGVCEAHTQKLRDVDDTPGGHRGGHLQAVRLRVGAASGRHHRDDAAGRAGSTPRSPKAAAADLGGWRGSSGGAGRQLGRYGYRCSGGVGSARFGGLGCRTCQRSGGSTPAETDSGDRERRGGQSGRHSSISGADVSTELVGTYFKATATNLKPSEYIPCYGGM